MHSLLAALAAVAVVSFALPALAQAPINPSPGGVKLPKGPLVPLKGPSTPLFPKRDTPQQVPEIQCEMTPEDTIFPAMLLAGANIHRELPKSDIVLGDGSADNAPIIHVVSHSANAPVAVTITCDDVMDATTFKGTLGVPEQTYMIMPKIRWKYKALAACRQQMPVNVVFRVKVGDRDEVEQVRTCSLRTIHDCPLQFQVGDQVAKVQLVFAAYVNEDHPWVDGILKEALATGLVQNFTGYQLKNDDAVLKQVEAIWRALQRHNIGYSNITNLAAPQGAKLLSQHVRFLDESIQQQQANCIDGTVMIASILRKIGINPTILIVPGHAFLAFGLDADGQRFSGLETTCIGQARLAIGDNNFEQASAASFQKALDVGNKRIQKDAARFDSQDPKDGGYVTIDIGAARQFGVQPIPYTEPGKDGPPKLIRIR